MRDPHVVWLEYRLVPEEDVTYESPPPVELETGGFLARLSEGVVRFDMKAHYASEEEARKPVEEFLRAWEIHSALRPEGAGVRFTLESAKVIDRDPRPPGTGVVEIPAASLIMTGLAPTVRVTRRAYPAPPSQFRASPDVKKLWEHYQNHRQGKERLTDMAYFCLTVLKSSAGGRREAARKYAIGDNVLSKLGKLSSERGEAGTARKMCKGLAPHSRAEVQWIHSALKAIILRVGQVDAGATNLAPMTLADLPRI